jgi:hypothetical protein
LTYQKQGNTEGMRDVQLAVPLARRFSIKGGRRSVRLQLEKVGFSGEKLKRALQNLAGKVRLCQPIIK